MNENNAKCSHCTQELAGKAVIHIALFDLALSPDPLKNLKSYHIRCFTENVAGKEFMYCDTISETSEGKIARDCSLCDKDADKSGVTIFESNSNVEATWSQYIHKECFLEKAGDDFFGE